MRKIKKGDQVIVMVGKDKGKRGVVAEVLVKDKLLVNGINIVKKHQKANPNRGVTGGIVEKGLPIHSSNVAIVNPATGRGDKIGFRLLADGRKVRFYKSTNEILDV